MRMIEQNKVRQLSDILLQVIKQNLEPEAFDWLEDKMELIAHEAQSIQLHLCFAHLPRMVSRAEVKTGTEVAKEIGFLLPGFSIDGWSLDRLCRVWLLLQLPGGDKNAYLKKITSLFSAAEMNEQVALYSALPFYFYPEEWVGRCEEGVRSNIGTVLEAIMYYNPYPAAFLSEPAWNQLVLKAFFTEKEVRRIVGLKERANPALAATLEDYINERMSAHRTVAPEIYELIEQTKERL